jgi:hypothetical protein
MAAILLLLMGAIVTSMSAMALWHALRTPLFGRRAKGRLTGMRYAYHQQWLRSGHFARTKLYYPIVRFDADDGSAHSVVSELGYEAWPGWASDHPFNVRYNPTNPRDATADPLTPTWVFPAVFLIAGLVVLVAGLRAVPV